MLSINKSRSDGRRCFGFLNYNDKLTKHKKNCHVTQKEEQFQGLHHQWNFHFEEHNYDASLYNDSSSLAAELQAAPWTPLYRPPPLPIYDCLSNPKQFLMIYEATISLYGGNTTVVAKYFSMAVKNVAQT